MDCAWDDGIPGSDRKAGAGLSWFSIFLRTNESRELPTAPSKTHMISASRFQIASDSAQPPRAPTGSLPTSSEKAPPLRQSGHSPWKPQPRAVPRSSKPWSSPPFARRRQAADLAASGSGAGRTDICWGVATDSPSQLDRGEAVELEETIGRAWFLERYPARQRGGS